MWNTKDHKREQDGLPLGSSSGKVKVTATYIKCDEGQKKIVEVCVGNLAERDHFVDLRHR
jgi:hypothetical protein